MFDFAWSEVALIAVVALVVIGPKDLPRALRTIGKFVSHARSIAREFQGSLEQMVREAELDEVKRDLEKVTRVDLQREFENTIDPKGELQRAMNDPALADPLAEPSAGHIEATGEAPDASVAAPAAIEAEAEPAALPAPETPVAPPEDPLREAEAVEATPAPAKSASHA